MTCMYCQASYCPKCDEDHKEDMTCEQFQATKEEEKFDKFAADEGYKK